MFRMLLEDKAKISKNNSSHSFSERGTSEQLQSHIDLSSKPFSVTL